ncbi:S24 family peptidase [Delftia sp.]|uniref:XRE family transcriptional regulator n=1 Tax=Delftia sp. TaxID=1886637 RepID=UPI00259CE6DC|nr:S24 family peptidase [Delftia sp.]
MSIHTTIKREREARGWSMELLAKKVAEEERAAKPLAWQTVQQWEKEGGTAPKRKRLEIVARLFGMTVASLLGETSDADSSEFVEVARLSVEVGAGPGRVNDIVEKMGILHFRRDFLKSAGVSPENAAIVSVKGTSMEPSISDGSILLLNRADRDPRQGCIYAFSWDGEMLVKRFQKIDGVWNAVSDNADRKLHPNIVIDGKCEALIQGRALWMCTKL